jgi:hypothetical protein
LRGVIIKRLSWLRGPPQGDALFYVNAANEMMEARLVTGPSLVLHDPKSLFLIGPEHLAGHGADYALYDVSPDDGSFLMLRLEEMETRELILVLNWLEELKRHVRDRPPGCKGDNETGDRRRPVHGRGHG